MDSEYDDSEITVVKEIPIPPPSPPKDQFGRIRRDGVDLGPQQTTANPGLQPNNGMNKIPFGEAAPSGSWQQNPGWQAPSSSAVGGWQPPPGPAAPPVASAAGPKFPPKPILGPARAEGWIGERQRWVGETVKPGAVPMPPWMPPNIPAAGGAPPAWAGAAATMQLPAPLKQPIWYTRSTLYPPPPNAPAPTTRERPLGCRTIFIGGLPELATQEVVEEIFGKCGEIQTLRMSKKSFCHIRYAQEFCVDNAMYLSGWRMRVGNSADSAASGRIHVDYAAARDDQYEFECKQRELEREKRHITKSIQQLTRPPSPPPLPHYSDHEAGVVTEQIRTGDCDKFGYSLDLLLAWLDRGNCNKKNADRFFSMIQAASSHVKRLVGERGEWEVEVERLREQHKARSRELRDQFKQIEKVFGGCSHQKVSDHFTKTQRKKIQGWRKELTDVMTAASLDEEEDMDLSEEGEVGTAREGDDDPKEGDEDLQPPGEDPGAKQSNGGGGKKRKKRTSGQVRDDGEELAQKAQVWKNELDSIRAEWQEDVEDKEKKIKLLQTAMQGMQQQLLEAKAAQGDLPAFLLDNKKKEEEKRGKEGTLVAEWPPAKRSKSKETEVATRAPPPPSAVNGTTESKSVDVQTDAPSTVDSSRSTEPSVSSSESDVVTNHNNSGIPGRDARSIATISTFLNVCSYGATTEDISTHVAKLHGGVDSTMVEQLLSRYPECFAKDEAKERTLWRLVTFSPVIL